MFYNMNRERERQVYVVYYYIHDTVRVYMYNIYIYVILYIYTFIRDIPMFFSCFFRLAATTKANGFSKGAQAIARFHALGQSLPMPHWYTNAAFWVLWRTLHCKHWVWKLEPLTFGGICHTLRSTLKQRVVNNHTCLKLKSFLSIVADTPIIVVESYCFQALQEVSCGPQVGRTFWGQLQRPCSHEPWWSQSSIVRRLTAQVKMVISRRKSFLHQGLWVFHEF